MVLAKKNVQEREGRQKAIGILPLGTSGRIGFDTVSRVLCTDPRTVPFYPSGNSVFARERSALPNQFMAEQERSLGVRCSISK